jgi:hypothetical protein
MKLVMLLFFLVAIISCTNNLPDGIENFIPGTYIRFSQHEYGTEHDTLVITVQNSSANEYRIMRKWKYERVLDGNRIEPEYKRTETSGIYSAKDKILQETETGDIISFDVKRNLLLTGSTEYQKIK